MIKKSITYAICCILLFTGMSAQAQNITLKGTVLDTNNDPIIGAVVATLKKDGNHITKVVTSDKQGEFSILTDLSKEVLRVSFFGFEDVDVTKNSDKPLSIVMKELSMGVDEVVVRAKNSVVIKADRLVFNVNNNNLTSGNDVMGVLKFTPLLIVDNDKLSMVGKNNVILYVNGKKKNISSSAVSGYLQSIPADKIDRIEIITDPGSNYRSDGNSGIINLVLKKDADQGLKGNVAIGDSQGLHNSYNGNLYLDYQKDKLAISSSLYGRRNKRSVEDITSYSFVDDNRYNLIENENINDDVNVGANITADYQLTEKQSIGAMVDFSYQKNDGDLFSTAQYSPLNSNLIDSTIYSENFRDASTSFFSSNLNYRLKTGDKGSELAFDVDFLLKDSEDLGSSSYYKDATTDPYTHFKQDTEDKYNTYSAKLEYKHVFTPMSKLSVGAEYYYMESSSNLYHGDYLDNNYVSDPNKSNFFNFNENYIAGFLNYNKVWNKKVITILGARGEYVYNKGEQKTTSENADKQEFNILPMLVQMYNINNNHSLSYTFVTSLNRIPFSAYNPFRLYISPTIYEESNPDLESSFAYINTLKYTLRKKYNFNINYIYTTKGTNTFDLPGENGMTKRVRANFGGGHMLFGAFNWNDSFLNNRLYLNLSLSTMYTNMSGKVEDIQLDINHLSYFGTINVGYQLSERYDWNLSASGMYRSAFKLAQEDITPSFNFDIEAKKGFKNGISLRFGIQSLFRSEPQRSKDYGHYSYFTNTIQPDMRSFFIGLSIPFGQKKVSGARKHSGSSSKVKGRI